MQLSLLVFLTHVESDINLCTGNSLEIWDRIMNKLWRATLMNRKDTLNPKKDEQGNTVVYFLIFYQPW